eukprot:scaffold34634_cov171-Amphora_coffeaeformis.AAC.2
MAKQLRLLDRLEETKADGKKIRSGVGRKNLFFGSTGERERTADHHNIIADLRKKWRGKWCQIGSTWHLTLICEGKKQTLRVIRYGMAGMGWYGGLYPTSNHALLDIDLVKSFCGATLVFPSSPG